MISLRQSLPIADSHYFAAAVPCSNYVAAVDMTSLQQPLSAIAGTHRNVAAVDLTILQQPLSAIDGSDFTAADMISLRQSRSVATTTLLQPSPAVTTSVATISLRQSLSIADSNYFAAAIACSYHVAAIDVTYLQQPLSTINDYNHSNNNRLQPIEFFSNSNNNNNHDNNHSNSKNTGAKGTYRSACVRPKGLGGLEM